MKKLYFDNAATTPLSEEVLEAMVPVMKEWVPEIFSYYEEKRLHKARLSP